MGAGLGSQWSGFGGRRRGAADDLTEVHEINVTPFIDVMLVLLIIFMVAAPLATVDLGQIVVGAAPASAESTRWGAESRAHDLLRGPRQAEAAAVAFP